MKTWDKEIEEVTRFYASAKLPEGCTYKPGETIWNMNSFVMTNLSRAKEHNGDPHYRVHLDRLIELKNYLEK